MLQSQHTYYVASPAFTMYVRQTEEGLGCKVERFAYSSRVMQASQVYSYPSLLVAQNFTTYFTVYAHGHRYTKITAKKIFIDNDIAIMISEKGNDI